MADDAQQTAAKVLIMDDDEMVRYVAGETLKRYGFQVDFANDGSQAVEIYRQHHQAGHPFAAVILDLNIPGGMGGEEAMRRLLEIDPAAKGYVSSGRTDDPVMVDALAKSPSQFSKSDFWENRLPNFAYSWRSPLTEG